MSAKFVLPGRALGVAGALFGGFLGTALGFGAAADFEFRSMMIPVFCAISILFGFRPNVDRSKA